MSTADMLDAIVIGGGIAGLAAAWDLRDRNVLVLEATDRVGGRIKSEPRGDIWLNFGAHVFSGAGFSLNADVFGVQTLGYQWRKGGVAIAGATTSAYAKAVAAVADAGVYDLVITNAYGTATSVPVTVSVVSYFPPLVLQQPVARSVFAGRTAQFSVVADGGQLAYQWNKGGTPISGATTTQLVISPVSVADAADYSVTVSNPAGSTNSVNAHLTVATIPATGYLGKVLADGPATLWRMETQVRF